MISRLKYFSKLELQMLVQFPSSSRQRIILYMHHEKYFFISCSNDTFICTTGFTPDLAEGSLMRRL